MIKGGRKVFAILAERMSAYSEKGKVCMRTKFGPSGRSLSRFLQHEVTTVFSTLLNGMLVHHRVTPSINFTGTHLYTWVERGTVRIKCLVQEHNTVSPVRARTRTARSGVERTNHEATAGNLVPRVSHLKDERP